MTPIPESLMVLLSDPAITDLCWNGATVLKIDRGQGFEASPIPSPFSGESEFRQFILEHLSLSGKTWDAKHPFVDTVFFGTHRAHVAFPPAARPGILLSLRRLTGPKPVIGRWEPSRDAFQLLEQSVLQHETLLLSGSTGSGKTTLFNDLLAVIPEQERLIVLEDTPELHPSHPHWIGLLSRPANADGFGEITIRDLLRQCLRMRPDRILMGECRGNEVLDLLLALNTGHQGTLATIHAHSAQDALRRVELLALIASQGTLPPSLIRSLISRGIKKVAHLSRTPEGRRITEVISIEGLERESIVCRSLYPVAPGGAPFRRPVETPRGI